MKKLFGLIVLSLLILPKNLYSQEKGYQQEINVSIGVSGGDDSFMQTNVSIVPGYRLSPSLFIGVGAGISSLSNIFINSLPPEYIVDDSDLKKFYRKHTVPFFVRGKGYFRTTSKSSFIMMCDLGVAIGSKEDVENLLGGEYIKLIRRYTGTYFFINPHIGASFFMGKNRDKSLDLTLGFRRDRMNSVELRLGFCF